jgi:NitT/TauT family transport system permease protein
MISLAIAVGAIALWEAGSRAGLISQFLAPAPSEVVRTLYAQFSTGEILPHLFSTLYRVLSGLAIGGSIGILSGALMGTIPRLRAIADPFLSAIHPVPKIAILPVVMALLGIGDASRIAVISLGVFFPMMINTLGGVRSINQTYLDVARNYGASGFRLLSRVMLPASLPMILSGTRIALNMGLTVTITTEITGARRGLGALIWTSWEVLRMDLLYATLVVIMVLGVSCNLTVKYLTRVLAPWSVDRRR